MGLSEWDYANDCPAAQSAERARDMQRRMQEFTPLAVVPAAPRTYPENYFDAP